jgi:tetratricopeptide (TPR) repeat protein
MLVPVIGLVQVGAQSHADRYTYLPSIGLVIAVLFGAAPGAGAAAMTAAASEAAAAIVEKFRRRLGVALVVACVPLLFATRAQAALWKDTRTLFCHALAVTNDNALAELIYGNALREDGDTEAALPHLRRAVQLAPGLADAHDGLGIALGATNRLDDAVAEFRAALRIEPRAGFHHNLGHALALLGRGDEAAGEFVSALRLDPAHAPSHEKLGPVLADLGRFGEAELAAQHAAEAARARGDEVAARRFETLAASWRARRPLRSQ